MNNITYKHTKSMNHIKNGEKSEMLKKFVELLHAGKHPYVDSMGIIRSDIEPARPPNEKPKKTFKKPFKAKKRNENLLGNYIKACPKGRVKQV